jgi:hypothetical protein
MPDFGIFRGFNEKLFCDKLYAGQLPTQLGLIGSQEVKNFDADAIAFFDRVTAAGGTLLSIEQVAINNLVEKLKTDSIWTKMKAIYPMVGASAAACAQNLKSSNFTGTFTSGWTFASTGATPNGTSAYMNTGYLESANATLNNGHLSFYSRTSRTTGDRCDIGAINFSQVQYSVIFAEGAGNITYVACQNIIGSGVISNNNSLGFFITTRTQSDQIRSFIRNNKFTTTINAGNLLNIPYYIGGRNSSGTLDSASNKECAMASMGDGLTDTEASNFYTAVQAFQTTLSRNV